MIILSRSFLLTVTACAALGACGGEKPMHSGYHEETYQSTSVGGHAARIALLERQVHALQDEVAVMGTTFSGLLITNERIDDLLTRLEAEKSGVAVEKLPPKKATTAKPAAKPTALMPTKDKATAPMKSYDKPTATALRIGEHTGKTRLVVDSNVAVPVMTDLDNSEKILLITVDAAWDGGDKMTVQKSPLVKSWSVQALENQKVIAVQLTKPVKILSSEKLKASDGNPARYIIDLAAE